MIGTGMMGQLAHLANYTRLRDEGLCDIVGVTDLKRQLATAVADRYRVPNVYDSVADLLADPRVDGVACIQQWPNNYALVKQVLAAGKSVITEKPMVGRLDEAEELTALANERNLHYAVGFMKRYDPGIDIAKDIIECEGGQGALGALLTVDAGCNGGDWLHNAGPAISTEEPVSAPPPPPTYPDGCCTAEQRAAYGWLLNIFSHNINLCHFLLGAEMQPCAARFVRDRALSATLRHGDVVISLRGARSRAHEWQEWTTFTYEQGTIQIVTPTPMNRQRAATVTVLREHGGRFTTTAYHADPEWAFYRQARGFVQAVQGEESPRASAERALWDVRVMHHLIEIAEVH